jgi:gliding motility-associated lipoprotein GldH
MIKSVFNIFKNIPRRFAIVLLFLPLILVISCSPGSIYDRSQRIPPQGWHKDSAAIFYINITDTIKPYRFFINLRHTDDYAYRNFYLFLNTTLPNGRLTRDTIEIMLADIEGRWLGKGFGSIRDNRFIVREILIFPQAGLYEFGIVQAMREDVLTGITDIGIRIE